MNRRKISSFTSTEEILQKLFAGLKNIPNILQNSNTIIQYQLYHGRNEAVKNFSKTQCTRNIPHRPVITRDNATTKLRIAYDVCKPREKWSFSERLFMPRKSTI
ncbi:hypothetical protein RF11_06506 [Thelohanellus kitauei]|uniref:Uncharacterized protein n=1 Tax=Thelohanellus kitauei TaxID=669202 RepID=A0A0C2JZU9_THEKT|nr:hypothetical protein RF11_11869 [Thelohanellus kitauei]KII75193.1 hypothetical protein RF11_06506 [Thelohanellus kitauei]